MSIGALASQLRGASMSLREPGGRSREFVLSALLVLFTAYIALSIESTFKLVFAGVVASALLLYMMRHQERALHFVLFFSTIYYVMRAVVFGWSSVAILFKEGALIILFGFWLFHFVLRGEKWRATPLGAPLAALVAWLLIEAFNPNTSGWLPVLDDLRFWLGPIAIYVLTVHLVTDREKLERGLRFVFTYAVIEAVYGIAQQFMPGDLLVSLGADPQNYFYFSYDSIRSFSTMGTTGFSTFAAMLAPFAFFYMSQQRSTIHRWAFLAMGFAFMGGVLYTLVRTAWVATAVSILAYALVTRRFQIVLVTLLLVFSIGSFASDYMRLKVDGLVNYRDDVSIQTRLEIAKTLSEGVGLRVFGYGTGTFASNRFTGSDTIGYGTLTENWYLMTSLELGWVGIGIMLWIWYKIYRMVWLWYHGGLRTNRYRELAVAIGASLLSIEVARLGGPAGYYPPDSWHYWYFVGLLMVLPKADEELAAEEASAAATAEAVVLRPSRELVTV